MSESESEIVGYQIYLWNYQIRHLGNPSGLPEILLKDRPLRYDCCYK